MKADMTMGERGEADREDRTTRLPGDAMPPADSPRGLDGRDAAALLALAALAVGLPLGMTAAAGGIGIPSNDGAVYMRGALSLLRTGVIDMPGHTAGAIGQLALVQPLLWLSGGELWAFTAFGLIVSLIAMLSSYLLARRFVGLGSAVLVALVVAAFPGFLRATTSFMTDVPASALGTVSLLLGVRWLQGDSRLPGLVASLGVGVLAFSIREFALAAPVAILLAAWAQQRAGKVPLLGASLGFAVAVAAATLLADSVAARGLAPTVPGTSGLLLLGPAFTTGAAVLLPATALAIGRKMATLSPQDVILAASIVLLGSLLPLGSLIGYFWAKDGMGGDALLSGARDLVISGVAWTISQQLAVLAAILLVALSLSWAQRSLARISPSALVGYALGLARSPEGPLVLFVAAYGAELVAYSLLGLLFDRYLYAIIPVAAILILRGLPQPRRVGRSPALSHAALAWLAVSAFLIAANAHAYDAARWRAGEAAVALGYDGRSVDAGFEWVGYHASGYETAGAHSYGLTWYDNDWPSFRPCAVVSNSPLEEGSLRLIRVDRSAYLQYLFFGPAEPLYLYGVAADGCPTPPAATQ